MNPDSGNPSRPPHPPPYDSIHEQPTIFLPGSTLPAGEKTPPPPPAHPPGEQTVRAVPPGPGVPHAAPPLDATLPVASGDSRGVPASFPAAETIADESPSPGVRGVPSPAAPSPPPIKGYELLAPLGRGTFGSVWRARHKRTGAEVAVKLFDHNIGADWDLLRREVECLLRVAKHPHVVTLLDADFTQHPPFYVMEMMSGSLEAEIRGARQLATRRGGDAPLEAVPYPNIPEALRWFEEMARGLLYIHGKAFLHCDLKPANVLLDDERHVRIVDFGQALLRGRDHISMGTLFYMPPEQTDPLDNPETAPPDVRWDIYALGATAYTLLVGKPPRSGQEQLQSIQSAKTVVDKLRVYRQRLLETPLQPLRSLHPRMAPDFAAIVEKCLELDPEKRYANVADILSDLDRMRQLQPLLCRRPWSREYLLRRFLRRNALWLVPFLALFFVLGISFYQVNRKVFRQRYGVFTMMHRDGTATTAEIFSNEKEDEVFDRGSMDIYLQSLLQARDHIAQGDIPGARKFLDSCQPDWRGWEWGRLAFMAQRLESAASSSAELGMERISGLPLTAGFVRPNPNGLLIAVNRTLGEAEVFSARDGKSDPDFLDGNRPFKFIDLGSDGKTAVFLRGNGDIFIRRMPDLSKRTLLVTHPGAQVVALSPDLRRLACADAQGNLVIRFARNGAEIITIPTGLPNPIAMEFTSLANKIVLYDSRGQAVLLQALPWK